MGTNEVDELMQINELMMQINALRDNARHWAPDDVEVCADTLQRMAANLPRLAREVELLRPIADVAVEFNGELRNREHPRVRRLASAIETWWRWLGRDAEVR